MEYSDIISRVKGNSITQDINNPVIKNQKGNEKLIKKAKALFEENKEGRNL